MKVRVAVVLAAITGVAAAAHAQTAVWDWTWIHADPVTFAPITNPQNPAALSPGEAALLRGSLTITGQGMNVVNHQNLSGVIAGLSIALFEFHAQPGHEGLFVSPVVRTPAYPTMPFIEPDRIRHIGVGQFLLDGLPLNFPQSHFENAVRIPWVPNHYEPRTADFFAINSSTNTFNPTGIMFAIDTTGNFYWAHYRVPVENITWGSVSVPIIPSPASLAILGASCLMIARRQR